MHYIVWLISQGAVPYRDTFDMNMPGVYLIHLAVLAVGGAGDLAWLVFERGWLAVAGVGMSCSGSGCSNPRGSLPTFNSTFGPQTHG